MWLGNYAHAYSGISANLYNFTYIFNIGVRKQSCLPYTRYTYVNVVDEMSEDIYRFFEKTTKEMHEKLENNQVIYVHCYVGMSRSPTIVIAYLIKYHKMSYEDAYNLVKKQRRQTYPNHGFREQLRTWERQCCKDRNNMFNIFRTVPNVITVIPDAVDLDHEP